MRLPAIAVFLAALVAAVASGPVPRAPDAQAAIAAADALSASRLGEACAASTYSECTTGCCVGGTCAPHAVCWPGGANRGAGCSASTWQQCDSGCCLAGACAHSSACFPAGLGAPHGAACSAPAACASGCCTNGTCASVVECFGEKGGPAVLPLAELLPGSNASCTRDYAGLASHGIVCQCDHVFVCGQCIPANSELLPAVAPLNRNCDRAAEIVAAWRNARVPPRNASDAGGGSGIKRRSLGGKGSTCVVTNTDTLYYGKVSYNPCDAPYTCDMVLGICVDKPTPLRDPKFACPKGAGTPSAGQAANKDNAVPGPFFDTAKLAVPPGTCTPCLDKGVFTAECPAGTACDAAVFETGLCLPVVRTEYDAHADGTATCSGKQPAGAKVSSPGECASCWIDARTSTCGPAPTGFLAAVAQVPKGWKVNLGSDKNSGEYRDSFPDWVPFREDSGLSGYRAYTEDGALLKTYAYASCAATKGRTADLRPEYGSKETLESGALVEWAAAWDRAFSGACDCGGKTARAVPPSAEKVGRQAPQQCPGIAQGCMQFVSGTCDRGITADAKAALGDALRCEAACEVRSEIAWLGSSQGWLAAADNLVAPLFDGMQASLLGALERLAGQGKADGTVFRFGFGFAGMVHWAFLDALATAALADAGARNGVDVGAGDRAAGSPLWGPLLALLGSSLDSIVPIMDNTSPSRQEFYYVFWQEGELSFKPATEVNQGGDKLKAYLKSSLDATLKVFRDRLLNDINKDRMRLYYFHAMDAASGIGISGDYALGKAGEVAGAVAAAAGRRYLRQVIPSFWDVCTVDQWDSWVPTDGITQSCATSKAGAYGVCPDWCGDKDSSTFEYAGNPSWAWSGGDEDPLGGTFPPFSAPWYRYREPKPDDWRLYANGQTTGTVVRSYYWPCGGAKGSGGPDDGGFTSLLEGAGCRRVEVLAGARTPENRIVCGAEGADLGYVQFSEGYWSQPFYDRRNGAWDMNDWPKHGTGAYRASPVTFGWLGMRNRRMRPCVDHY